jgi:hypothetical protein
MKYENCTTAQKNPITQSNNEFNEIASSKKYILWIIFDT